MTQSHFSKLERMYLQANVNTMIFDTTTINIRECEAEIGLTVSEKYFHALGAIHGTVYFKLLDDAAFFAANSLAEDRFLLTTSFNIQIIRPVSSGVLRSVGKVRYHSRKLFVADANLYNEQGKEVADME